MQKKCASIFSTIWMLNTDKWISVTFKALKHWKCIEFERNCDQVSAAQYKKLTTILEKKHFFLNNLGYFLWRVFGLELKLTDCVTLWDTLWCNQRFYVTSWRGLCGFLLCGYTVGDFYFIWWYALLHVTLSMILFNDLIINLIGVFIVVFFYRRQNYWILTHSCFVIRQSNIFLLQHEYIWKTGGRTVGQTDRRTDEQARAKTIPLQRERPGVKTTKWCKYENIDLSNSLVFFHICNVAWFIHPITRI